MNCFQFRFELEEDLKGVLANRPYQFSRWMIVLQRWEPIISSTFPSQIPFWIRLHGLPLHYWHEKALYNISLDLGSLDDYSITKTSVKIRVSLDVFKPLEKEVLFDFSSGEELVLQLEYENLDRHCSECNSLLHDSMQCPMRKLLPEYVIPSEQTTHSHSRDAYTRERKHTPPPEKRASDYSQRVDKHGRPFGERLPLSNRGGPLKNRLTSASGQVPSIRGPDRSENRRHLSRSPPRPLSRRHHETRPSLGRYRPPQQQWREKTRGATRRPEAH